MEKQRLNQEKVNQLNGSIQKSEDLGKSKGFTRRQKLTLGSIALANLADTTSFSILAPFFPTEANMMGASDTVVGLIFGCFSLVMFITSPIFGKLLPFIGAKRLFLTGSFVCGGCMILFGFLDKLNNSMEFIIFCFVLRSLAAAGAAASSTASFTIVAQTFPGHLSTVFGILEVFIGLGYMIGPPFGAYLYKVGGYTMPFAVLGGLAVLVVLLNLCILPRQGDGSRPKSGSVLQLLAIPSVLMTALCTVVGAMALGYLMPSFTKHLKEQFHVDVTGVGWIYFILSVSYASSSCVWGYMSDKLNIAKLLMIVGNIGAAGAYLYLGPSPLLQTKSELWLLILSMILLGISVGCSFVPTFSDMFISARWYGMPDDMSTHGVVSGVYSGFYSLGSFIGPTAGGALSQVIGFNWGVTVISTLYLLVALLLILFCLWEYQCGKGRRVPRRKEIVTIDNCDKDERIPLSYT